MTQQSPETIDAEPTKEFFIMMLTRDIPLKRAVLDLVDNAVDAARSLAGDGSLNAFEISIEVSDERFKITDNCGGISINTARHFAFRFGRAEGSPQVEGSIGQFGVGMKRALFKMGTGFSVRSQTRTDRFSVDEDIVDWATRPSWKFRFQDLQDGLNNDLSETGTTITVEPLHDSVRAEFATAGFRDELWKEIVEAEQTDIGRGLHIRFNGVPAGINPSQLLQSDQIGTYYEEMNLEEAGLEGITLRLYAGLADSNPRQAGWYVFCNGRLVLGPDTTGRTVWGETDEASIPRFHNQYARFRGYAFFESQDAGQLPWTTTKTDVDSDHAAYRYGRRKMIAATRPLIDFLNDLKDESDAADDSTAPGPLAAALASALAVPLRQLNVSPLRVPIAVARPHTSTSTIRIQYNRPRAQVNALKSALGASSAARVGELSFDYAYKREVED